MTGEEGSSTHNRVLCKGPPPATFHIGVLSGDPLLSITAVRNGDVRWSAFATAFLVSLPSQDQVAPVFCNALCFQIILLLMQRLAFDIRSIQ